MKKGYQLILVITLSFVFLIGGIFLGRRTINGTLSIETGKQNKFTPENPSVSDALGDGKININYAGVDELTLLPGIGETLAERIIAYREVNGKFDNVNDLMNVEGIGEGKLSQILKYITVE